MQRLEDSGAVRPIYGSLGVKRLMYGVNMGRGKRFRGGGERSFGNLFCRM